jgi:hypothetical protein
MSERITVGGVTLIILESEPDRPCELCGTVTECRPYGPGGKQVCFDCAMKDEKTAKRMMNKRLFDEETH